MSLFLFVPFLYCLPFYCSLSLLCSLPLFPFLIVSSIYRDLDAMLFPSASYIAFRSVVTYSYNLSFLHCIQIVLSALRILVLKLSFQQADGAADGTTEATGESAGDGIAEAIGESAANGSTVGGGEQDFAGELTPLSCFIECAGLGMGASE